MHCFGEMLGGREIKSETCKNAAGKIIVESKLPVIEFSLVFQFSHSSPSLASMPHYYMTPLLGVLAG